MISNFRIYEATQRAIAAQDETLQRAIESARVA
jgi:flagellar basal body rod protein FlgG